MRINDNTYSGQHLDQAFVQDNISPTWRWSKWDVLITKEAAS